MPGSVHVIAGRCRTVFEGTRAREQYGDAIVIVKADGTVLVHDANGYQPAAWLTRPESVTVAGDTVTARDGEQSLRVTVHETYARGRYPSTDAGVPVGECPDCETPLVRARGDVSCPDCSRRHSLPAGATVLEESYPDCETGFSFPDGRHVDDCTCGLPVFETPSGRRCLDRECTRREETTT